MNEDGYSEKYASVVEDFISLSLEEQFGDSVVIIIDDNASCHRFRIVKNVLSENIIHKTKQPVYSPDIKHVKNKWYVLKNMACIFTQYSSNCFLRYSVIPYFCLAAFGENKLYKILVKSFCNYF